MHRKVIIQVKVEVSGYSDLIYKYFVLNQFDERIKDDTNHTCRKLARVILAHGLGLEGRKYRMHSQGKAYC